MLGSGFSHAGSFYWLNRANLKFKPDLSYFSTALSCPEQEELLVVV